MEDRERNAERLTDEERRQQDEETGDEVEAHRHAIDRSAAERVAEEDRERFPQE